MGEKKMTNDQVKKNVIRSALTSYLRIAVRMGLGLVTFRLLYQHLTSEEFGFWSLLWAVFGYGILLDFGFGYSAQKRVAELSVKQDWAGLSRVLSTIFFFYVMAATAAFIAGYIFSGPLIDMFKVSAVHHEEYRRIMLVFLAGIGVAFPFGIFPEVLQGQQRIAAWNNVVIAGALMNAAVIVATVVGNWSFMVLVILSLMSFLLPYFIAARLSLQHMPEVKINPALFCRKTIVDTSRFSLYAYANTLGNILRNKTDQPVISSVLGVAQVTPYQAGSKVGDMFSMMTSQLACVLAPAAAHLHARGDAAGLREILLSSMRFSILAATPLYVVTAAYMEGVIRILTGVKHPTAPMIWSGELLLFWYYSLVLTHSVFKNMFMMAGQEKRMMLQGVSEAVINLALSIGLTFWLRRALGVEWGILGVALGSVIPTFLFGWGMIWGWAAHEAHMGRWELFCRLILPVWRGCLPMIAVALALRCQTFWASGSNTILTLAEGAVVGGVGLGGVWLLTFHDEERERYAAKILGKLGRKTKGVAT